MSKGYDTEYLPAVRFYEKHNKTLDLIASMEADAEFRWNELKELKLRDDLILDAMQVYNPAGYRNITEQDSNVTKHVELGIASYFRKYDEKGRKVEDIDPMVFTAALKQAVTDWSLESDHPFMQIVIMHYRHMADVASSENYTAMSGLADTERRTRSVRTREVKAVRDIRKYRNETGTQEDLKESMDKFLSKNGLLEKSSQASLKRIEDMLNGLNSTESLDVTIEEDERGITTRKDLLADTDNPFSDILSGSSLPDDEKFLAGWESMLSVMTLRTQEIMRLFFTRSILIELKLYHLTEDERKLQDKDRLEPECVSWCPVAGSCNRIRDHRKCYIRYNLMQGNIAPQKERDGRGYPAGDPEIYSKLKNMPKTLAAVLDEDYLKAAFRKTPDNLYDIYAGFLKDHSGNEKSSFRFTDMFMSKSLGINPSAITRTKHQLAEAREVLAEMLTD